MEKKIPDLKKADGYSGSETLRQIIHFDKQDEERFRYAAANIINANWHVYPSINFRAPYFNRKTNRVIFQMTSGLPMIKWFETNFNVQIVYLIRHPIPNALSIINAGWQPECFEFLENQHFVESHLTVAQVDLARKIESSDDELARHVLDWCLKNLVPQREIAQENAANWLCMSYEDLVARPVEVIQNMAQNLDLSDYESMIRQVKLPSRTVTASTGTRVEDSSYLLARWRQKINAQREQALMKILDSFEIDAYVAGRDEPRTSFLLSQKTK